MNLRICKKDRFRRKTKANSLLEVIWKKSVTENGLFFEKLGIDKFSAAGESTTAFLGWPSASENISKFHG